MSEGLYQNKDPLLRLLANKNENEHAAGENSANGHPSAYYYYMLSYNVGQALKCTEDNWAITYFKEYM